MSTLQNPSNKTKWKCKNCNTWSAVQARQCSWCGKYRPDDPRPSVDITANKPQIKNEQELLNKIRILAVKLSVDQKRELVEYMEKTFKV